MLCLTKTYFLFIQSTVQSLPLILSQTWCYHVLFLNYILPLHHYLPQLLIHHLILFLFKSLPEYPISYPIYNNIIAIYCLMELALPPTSHILYHKFCPMTLCLQLLQILLSMFLLSMSLDFIIKLSLIMNGVRQ